MKLPRLKDCPEGGTGVHNWLFYAACRMVEAEVPNEQAVPAIRKLMTREPTPHTEIEDALRSAKNEDREPQSKWPMRNQRLVNLVLAKDEWKPEPTSLEAPQALRLLYPGDPLLCIGQDNSHFTTRLLSEHRFTDRMGLIVPNPMTGKQGKTKQGHMSAHALSITGPRHYLIVEFDWGLIQGQLKLLCHLSEFARLVMVVHSGSKSAHGWFDVRRQDEEKTHKFFEYAVEAGADPRLWLRSQFCRMPGGFRSDKNKRQAILYIDEAYLGDQKIAKSLGAKTL